ITVTNQNDCDSTLVLDNLITVNENPNALFLAEPWYASIVFPVISFENRSEGHDSTLWKFGDGQISTLEEVSHTYTDTGTYQVVLTALTKEGCSDSDTNYVTINEEYTFYAPDAFLPEDGLGRNNEFRVFGNGLGDGHFHLLIFDRWGEKVYESYKPDHAWDGTVKNSGRIARPGVYVWQVFYSVGGKMFYRTGYVTLIR
ncbi:MAG: gliding motility-associated C-terminal domain-containing protein, partial [Bacteroidetes bacterium]|nr:gliding motility-associated C-terminal domain-containing protein [Bacteroidota bacterium]